MDIENLIDDYLKWLKNEISFAKIGEYYEISTPFLNNANDYLQIYVRQQGNDIYFSDDGSTLNNIFATGITLTENRREYLNNMLYQYGVQLKKNEIIAKSPIGDFSHKKHMFIQAMLRVEDLLATTKSKVTSFFLDDIQEFFDKNEIYSSENVQFTGISGYSHNYDFLLTRTKRNPERLCKALNNPTKQTMESVLFAWSDTKPSRKNDSQLIVFLNDKNRITKGVIEGLDAYGAKPILWSERNKPNNIELLTA